MQRVLVATDFSTRSDRALRRGGLLARQVSAELILVHVVDDDQPRRLIEAEQHEATALLQELCRTVREIDGIACESRVVLGDAFQGLTRTADETGADLLIIGPHRRQVLRDTFIGTTAERTIRTSRKPVLMANGIPAGPYRKILLATDLSETSLIAARSAKQLGLLDAAEVVALHVLDFPEAGPVFRASMTVTEFETYIAEAAKRASGELEAFTRDVGIVAARRVITPTEESTEMAINNYAKIAKVDLIVVGTHGRSGIEKWLLGRVAERVCGNSEVDVLAVPRP